MNKFLKFFRCFFIRCHHLTSRMKHHIRICRTDLTHLLRIIPRKFRHKAFLVAGLAASTWKHKVLTVRVQHRQCQLVMDILALNRIFGQIIQEISCPVVVPFIRKTNIIILHASCQFWPETVLLRDSHCSRQFFLQYGIQMFQKFYCFKIFICSVDIRSPLSIFSAKIKIQHRIDIVQSQTICMIKFHPVKRIGKKEILNHRAVKIK